ncbi:aldehyde dehydrogenase family protein [Acinetobacter bereziniae]|uniref:aldehyde dehydrogenase family protein n=1 Tax=Acinetobacter bereziniae TaxID=106648 RepID=UPI00300AF550
MKDLSSYTEHFINGQWILGSSQHELVDINPYDNHKLTVIQAASKQDVDSAYTTALEIFNTWKDTSAIERSNTIKKIYQVIESHREDLIEILIAESGSTRLKANAEIDAALAITKESIEYPFKVGIHKLKTQVVGQESLYYKKPLGVIGVISPWNFPFHLSIRSIIPAIALGNTVVLKPASDTPISGGLVFGKIAELAEIPNGVLNVVAGLGSEIGDYFVEHDVPKFISFTGSTKVGKRVGSIVLNSNRIKRLALELGGNAPLIVLDDADLDKAVDIALFGRFLHQGQICMSTNRVIVDESVHDEFVERLLKKVTQIKYGNPSDITNLVGPIINKSQIASIVKIIDAGKNEGATLVYGENIIDNIIPPHIFINVLPNTTLSSEEIFGPVMPIMKAKNDLHAVQLANDTEYGLSSSICSENFNRAINIALKLEVGMTHINDISIEDSPFAPFGGEKNSGLGRFNGQWIIDEFTTTQWVTKQLTAKTYPL